MIDAILTLFCCSSLIFGNVNSTSRYLIFDDPNDSTSFNDAHILLSDTTYEEIMFSYFDIDYFVYTAPSAGNVHVYVTCASDNLSVDVYNYSTGSQHVLYSSNDPLPTYGPSGQTVFTGKGDVLRIKVSSTSTASFYDVRIVTNLSLDNHNVLSLFGNNIRCEYYYGISPHVSQIKYKIDSSCNVLIGNNKYIFDAYRAALDYWNMLGSVTLTEVNTGEDVLLKTEDDDFFDDLSSNNSLVLGYTKFDYEFFLFGGFNFFGEYICVPSNTNYIPYGQISLYERYLKICIHEIGHTLGIADFYANDDEDNIMYGGTDFSSNYTFYFGDKDIESYNYIWR